MGAAFRAILIGGTGQVGGAVLQALLATPDCREIVHITRKPLSAAHASQVRPVVMDTGADDFEAHIAALTRDTRALGDRVVAISCVGVGSGTAKWSETRLRQVEVGVVGAFARGVRAAGVEHFGLLSAAGATSRSRLKYVRVMGLKEEAVQAVGFPRLAIFRPGIIEGNAHTPAWIAWLGRLIPDPWGNIAQRDIGRAFAAAMVRNAASSGAEVYGNRSMRGLAAAWRVG
ncbi:hypothetical protein [Amphibiibacter pelophylacis]|uniref:Uncharacterized protein n=1 Tax=Amphibiibacter pelophylacis TaxID=1799477 RepID=A0ACC6P172_9BURK